MRRPLHFLLFIGLAMIAPAAVSAADSQDAATKAPSIQELVARIKPSIVTITFNGRGGERQGLGTGFIVRPDGLIATNLHVIGEARPIQVQLSDRRKFDVISVEATDRHHDLAVIKIDASDLPALELGNSDELQEGASVVAIGNPLGLERSVVSGVLSGRREVDGRPMLQVALPIERGNSGGPLLDLNGRVHGLITLKSLRSDNLGFAAPVNELKPMLENPNPIAMSQWLTIGVLSPEEWTAISGGRWSQRSGRILVEGAGSGFGARALCLATAMPPEGSYEVAVSVRFEPEDGAAGLVFHSDGADRHYGFYPSNGELRLSRFEGPDVYAWTVLSQVKSARYRADGWNHLKVHVEPERIRCYLNDELVIESDDTAFRSGRVGLCKFRNTKAEFRDFQVGQSLPGREPTAELLEKITQTTKTLPLNRPASDETVHQFLGDGRVALEALEREARELETRAARLRELSAAVHEARVIQKFEALTQRPETELDLLHAGLLIAAIDNPELDVDAYRAEVDRMADRIRQSLPKDPALAVRLEAMRSDLFEKQGFHGSRHDYDHRSNSYLNEVIDDREGIPITLSVLFIEIGQRLGIPMVGVGLPGHFVVRYEPPAGESQLIDVFDRGKVLTIDEAKERAISATGEWEDRYLDASPKRSILVRMLRNLFSEARRTEDLQRMLRYTHLILILEPESAPDRFYRAVLALQLQHLELARAEADWLQEHPLQGLSRRAVEDLSQAIDRERAAIKP